MRTIARLLGAAGVLAVTMQLTSASVAAVQDSPITPQPCVTPGSAPMPSLKLVGPKGKLDWIPWFLELGSDGPVNGITLISAIELVPSNGMVTMIDRPRWMVTPRVTDVPLPPDLPRFDASVLLPRLAPSMNYRVVLDWQDINAPKDCPITFRETIGEFTTGS